MVTLTEKESLRIEIETAWENFCDTDPENHARVLKVVDPIRYKLMELAFAHGYADGAQSVYRSLQK